VGLRLVDTASQRQADQEWAKARQQQGG